MKILTDFNFKLNNTAVCIGKFDGIHRGHRMLLEEAEKSDLEMVMITFLFPEHKGIYSYEEKQYLAEKLGIDILITIPVTKEFMQMPADEFVREILVKRCDAKKVVVGADFCFGYKRQGNASFLKEQGAYYGFEVCILDKLKQDGEVISSTRIRSLLAHGKIEQANELLQTPYFVKGRVEEGNKIGRTMSIPTANIRPSEEKELPPFGVYAVRVEIDGCLYDGVSNLGIKPTIPGKNPTGLEVWLFEYEGNLYGRELMVFFYSYQRPEQKFSGIRELREQIRFDTEQAKKLLISSENYAK